MRKAWLWAALAMACGDPAPTVVVVGGGTTATVTTTTTGAGDASTSASASASVTTGAGGGAGAGAGAHGGGGGATSSSQGGGGGIAPPECVVGEDCPGVDNACRKRTCTDGVCGVDFVAAGAPAGPQTEGDCETLVCDGAGNIETIYDPADVEDDGQECTEDSCTIRGPVHTPKPPTTPCSAGDFVCGEAHKGDVCPCKWVVQSEGVSTCEGGWTCDLGYFGQTCAAGWVCDADAACVWKIPIVCSVPGAGVHKCHGLGTKQISYQACGGACSCPCYPDEDPPIDCGPGETGYCAPGTKCSLSINGETKSGTCQ